MELSKQIYIFERASFLYKRISCRYSLEAPAQMYMFHRQIKKVLGHRFYLELCEPWRFQFIDRLYHYENTPIQIFWKFHLQKLKIFR